VTLNRAKCCDATFEPRPAVRFVQVGRIGGQELERLLAQLIADASALVEGGIIQNTLPLAAQVVKHFQPKFQTQTDW